MIISAKITIFLLQVADMFHSSPISFMIDQDPFSFDVSQCFYVYFVVLLLGARVAASAAAISKGNEEKAWLILAWVSTIAGNFSLLGSAANLIVCEQARRAPNLGYTLTFWTHLKFGLPSTLIVTAIGLTLIK